MSPAPIRNWITLSLNCIFGYLPSFIFLFWVERHCSIPFLPQTLQWPWIFVGGTPLASTIFNLIFIISLGALCLFVQRNKESGLIIARGVCGFLIMSFWQPTGIVIYELLPSAMLSSMISFMTFWGIFYFAAKEFPIWHPRSNLFFLAMLLVSPLMTLDRLIIFIGSAMILFYEKNNPNAFVRDTPPSPSQ